MPRPRSAAYGSKTRVTGVATEQTIKSSPGILGRIVVHNGDAASQTLTLKDGGDTLAVYSFAAGESVSLDFGVEMATSILVTPSDAQLDALVIFD